MANLPKIAQQRLEKASHAGRYSPSLAHPDADLLTAFVERNLAASDREQVMSHLATCAECREVVALSSPVADEIGMAVLDPARVRWTQWKFLRFGAGAAMAAVLVGVFLFTRVEKRVETTQLAGSHSTTANVSEIAKSKESDAFKPGMAASSPEQNRESAAKGAGVSPAKRSQRSGSTVLDDKNAALISADDRSPSKNKDAGAARTMPSLAASVTAKSGEVATGGLIRDRQSGDQTVAMARRTVSPPTFERPQQNPAGASRQGIIAGDSSAVTRPAMQPNSSSASVSADDAQRRAELKASAESPAPTADLAMQQKQNTADAVSSGQNESRTDEIAARKKTAANAISARSGSPEERRLGQAVSGAMVNPTPVFGAQSEAIVVKQSEESKASGNVWRIGKGKLQKSSGTNAGDHRWKDVDVGSPVKLHALVVQGQDIWVGGDCGTLLHSGNNGADWDQAKGDWTGNIVSLRFNSLQQGLLATSTHETWRTGDGGVTWQKQ